MARKSLKELSRVPGGMTFKPEKKMTSEHFNGTKRNA